MTATPDPKASETSARPKVLRRPPQFSRKPDAAEPMDDPLPAAILPTPPAVEPTTPNRSPGRRSSDQTRPAPEAHWSEDSRFGMALIFGVVLVNSLLGLLLPLMHKKELPTSGGTTTMLHGEAALPSPTAHRDGAGVTTYSDDKNRDGDRMDLNALPEGYNEFSTDPKDMPAPAARRLDAPDADADGAEDTGQ